MNTRPRAHRASLASLLLGSLFCASAALAADQVVPLPGTAAAGGGSTGGWHVSPELFAASIENLAVPLQADDASTGARVLQARGEQVLSTDLPGAVTSLAYSFDGRFLLVQHGASTRTEAAVDGLDIEAVETAAASTSKAAERGKAEAGVEAGVEPGTEPRVEAGVERAKEPHELATEHLVSLIGADGAILWTKTDDRRFEFSTTGEVLAAYSEEPGTGLRSDVEVIDLKGKTVRMLPVSRYAADAALVLGDGKRAVLMVERSLLCIDFTRDGAVIWRHDLSRPEPDFMRVFSLAPDKIILQLAEGRFKLFQPFGTLAYDYDPATVALTYPEMTEAEAKQLAPEAGPNPCSLTVFSGSPNARQIHIGSSKVFKKFVSLEAPGYKRIGGVVAGKLVFVSPTSILIRSLKDDFKPPTGEAEL